MTIKHNKKRNTGFVYEALIRELTRAAVEGRSKRKVEIAKTIKEHFSRDTILGMELDCYRVLNEASSLSDKEAEKLVSAAKEAYDRIDKDKLFLEQSRLINLINKNFGSYVFSNYVPNYKDLATISSLFNRSTSIKTKVLMEQKIVKRMCEDNNQQITSDKEVNDLVVREFTKSFNKEYSHLLPEQRQFLNLFIGSENDGGVEFKVFLNEELHRIKSAIQESKSMEEVKNDQDMVESTDKVLSMIEEYKQRDLSDDDLKKFMKLQKLVSEYQNDAN